MRSPDNVIGHGGADAACTSTRRVRRSRPPPRSRFPGECDLPPDKRKALHARIKVEQEAEAKAAGFPNHAAMVEARLDAWAKTEGFPSYAAMCNAPIPF